MRLGSAFRCLDWISTLFRRAGLSPLSSSALSRTGQGVQVPQVGILTTPRVKGPVWVNIPLPLSDSQVLKRTFIFIMSCDIFKLQNIFTCILM